MFFLLMLRFTPEEWRHGIPLQNIHKFQNKKTYDGQRCNSCDPNMPGIKGKDSHHETGNCTKHGPCHIGLELIDGKLSLERMI